MHILLKKEWQINDLNEKLNNFTVVERVLNSRNIIDSNERENYLSSPLEIIHDPFLLNDMENAVQIIIECIVNKEKILIYGDYDVDGISSTASLYMFLESLGAFVECIIPDRVKHGYGLSNAGKDEILQANAQLVITVDCGISSIEEISQLRNENVKVIVTDHHECKETLPKANAVINPKRQDSIYPFKELAGAGVTLKLIQAICLMWEEKHVADKWKDYLDIITLGTIGDIVPLIDENRNIVKHGLYMLKTKAKAGLLILLEKLQIKPEDINTLTVSYNIVPYINAAGRMGDGTRALNLLTGKNQETWENLSDVLIAENDKRRETEGLIVKEAKEQIIKYFDPMSYKVLVAYNKSWHQGVLGIVASRLTEYFQRSVIVFGWDKNCYKGSARSAANDSVLDAITYAKDHTIAFGGHKKAAGLSVSEDKMNDFIKAIDDFSSKKDVKELYDSKIEIDTKVNFEELTIENAQELEKMEPFGMGNEIPTFYCQNLTICKVAKLSEGKHQKFIFSNQNIKKESNNFSENYYNIVEGIAFGFNHDDYSFFEGDVVDVVFNLKINEWKGKRKVQLIVKDIRKSSIENECNNIESEKMNKDNIKTVYKYLINKFDNDLVICDLDLLATFISDEDNKSYTTFKLCKIFDIFEESKLIKVQKIKGLRVVFQVLNVKGKVDLLKTNTYTQLFL